jgi:phenol 2-monooxygenase (NADPH)
MNVSMQDAFNLGWKLGLVCQQKLQRSILATYEAERKQIAKQLIEFDHRFSRLFSGRPAKDILDETGVSMDEFGAAFNKSHLFTSAVGVHYPESELVFGAPDTTEAVIDPRDDCGGVAAHCVPGTRFPSFPVTAQVDARTWELHHKMPSDGRFRIVVFAGDISDPARLKLVDTLGAWIQENIVDRCATILLSPGSNPHDGSGTSKFKMDKDPSIVHVLLVHSAPRCLEGFEMVRDLHEMYRPFDSKLGWDYDRVFVDEMLDGSKKGEAYKGYGVDRKRGAVVVVRPDGYIGCVTELQDNGWMRVKEWFEGVLR